MIALAKIISSLALIGTILPAVLFLVDRITLDQTKLWMLIATVGWFASAPLREPRPALARRKSVAEKTR